MNKIQFFTLATFAIVNQAFAQLPNPVKWTFTVEQLSGDEATLMFNASIDPGWHIYSQFTPDGGPLPTVFTFEENGCYGLVGKPTEPAAHEEYDSTFEVKVLTLDGKPSFTQKIKLNEGSCTIKGRIDGQVCKEVCIMFGSDFTFTIGEPEEKDATKN